MNVASMYRNSTGSTVTIDRAFLNFANGLADGVVGVNESTDVTRSVEEASDTERSMLFNFRRESCKTHRN